MQVLRAIEEHDEVIIAKARQLGISWLMVGYGLWTALFKGNTKVLLLSQGEKESRQLLDKCLYIYQHIDQNVLPLPSLGTCNRETMELPRIDSVIEALPSTKTAGRSTDATLVIRDELEYHEWAEVNASAIGPALDAGGKCIELSTLGENMSSYFRQKLNNALSGKNNCFPIFLGVKLRPVRQEGMTFEEWFEKRVVKSGKYSAAQIEREYPFTLEQALKPPRTSAFFDVDVIEEQERALRDVTPIPHELTEIWDCVSIFKLPEPGVRYCAFCDPSDGKEDPHCTIVINAKTGEEVAESHGKTDANEAARIYDKLVRFYNGAFNSFELNAFSGGKFQMAVKELKTPNPYFYKPDTLGIWEGQSFRNTTLVDLRAAMKDKAIQIKNVEALDEMRYMMIGDKGKPEVPRGVHDDYISAWKGVWAVRRAMPWHIVPITSTKYKDG